MTRLQLRERLRAERGTTIVTLWARTRPRLLKRHRETKKPCPFFDVVKIAEVNGVIGFRYSRSVNAQRAREHRPTDRRGNLLLFSPQPRPWGVHVPATPLVEHEGKAYLEIKVQRVQARYEGRKCGSAGVRECGGKKNKPARSALATRHSPLATSISPEMLAPYLRRRKPERRQGVESPVVLRDYALTSLTHLRLRGVLYEIVEETRKSELGTRNKKKPAQKKAA